MTDKSYKGSVPHEIMCTCSICDKDMYCGDPAYATITGSIEDQVQGFMPGDLAGWLTVVCEDCGRRISDKIVELMKEGGTGQ